jgi:hypothetical protein
MAPPSSPPSPLQAHVRRLWLHGFLAGLVLVFIIVAAVFYIWGWPGASEEEAGPPPPEISQTPQTPTAPPAASVQPSPPPAAGLKPSEVLKIELTDLLSRMEEANKKKDLHLFLGLFARSFPDLPQKAQEISRTWKAYDYPSLHFRIEEVKSETPDNAFAKVIWEGQTRNRATRKTKPLSQTFLVWFSKDAGHWHISSLEKAP